MLYSLLDSARIRFDPKEKTLYLSKIFKWFAKDFKKYSGSVTRFVAPYLKLDPKDEQALLNNEIEIEYLDYDWSLNRLN